MGETRKGAGWAAAPVEEDPNAIVVCNSPPCFMHELDPSYLGHLSQEEVSALLEALLAARWGAVVPSEEARLRTAARAACPPFLQRPQAQGFDLPQGIDHGQAAALEAAEGAGDDRFHPVCDGRRRDHRALHRHRAAGTLSRRSEGGVMACAPRVER